LKDKQIRSEKFNKSTLLLFLVVFTLSILSAHELFYFWIFSRVESKSWILFLIWMLPIFWYYLNLFKHKKTPTFNIYALYATIIFTLIGVIGSLNTLCYIGFAVSFMVLLPPKPALLIWLLGAICWMPAMGWVALWYFSSYAFLARATILIICSLWASYVLQTKTLRGLENE
jgi:hypothetical protein